MSLLVFLAVAIIVYILSFKSDFTPEHIEVAAPFVIIVSALLLFIGILGSI